MTKSILEQYIDLKREVEELEKRIEKYQKKVDKINSEGNVKDAVKGGFGGIQTFHIDGFPAADEEEIMYLIRKNIRILKERKMQVREMLLSVEEYISQIDDSRMRRMITYRYIDGFTWWKVAQNMGKSYTEESCKKQMERFLSSK